MSGPKVECGSHMKLGLMESHCVQQGSSWPHFTDQLLWQPDRGMEEFLTKDVASSNTKVSLGVVLIANLSALTNTYHKEKRGSFCLIVGTEAKVKAHM